MIAPLPDLVDPERRLTLAYARPGQRAALATLWALDEALGGVLRGGREMMVSQLRLTWWHAALCRLDEAPPPAQPVLDAIAKHVLPMGVTGASLAAMIDGWEALLDPDPIADEALASFAARRGGGLFVAARAALGAEDGAVELAGQGWALVDLARHTADHALATRGLALARPLLARAMAARWSPAARPIGMIAHLANIDAQKGSIPLPPQGSPGRLLRMLRHRLTGQ